MEIHYVLYIFAIVWSIVYAADSSLSQSLDKVEKSSISLADSGWNVNLNQSLKEFIYGPKLELDSAKQQPIIAPCSCADARCSCCAGIRIYGFGYDRQACAIFSYANLESAFHLEFLLNNNIIYESKLTVKNQQVCIPILRVTLAGPFDVCLRLYDVAVVNERVHACLAMHGRLSQNPVIILQFNCMEMGVGGVALTRPLGGNFNESEISPPEVSNTTTEQTEQISGI